MSKFFTLLYFRTKHKIDEVNNFHNTFFRKLKKLRLFLENLARWFHIMIFNRARQLKNVNMMNFNEESVVCRANWIPPEIRVMHSRDPIIIDCHDRKREVGLLGDYGDHPNNYTAWFGILASANNVDPDRKIQGLLRRKLCQHDFARHETLTYVSLSRFFELNMQMLSFLLWFTKEQSHINLIINFVCL